MADIAWWLRWSTRTSNCDRSGAIAPQWVKKWVIRQGLQNHAQNLIWRKSSYRAFEKRIARGTTAFKTVEVWMLAGIRKLVFSIVSKLRHNCGRTANALWVTITSAITVLRAVQWHEKSCVAIVDNYAAVSKKCVTWEGFDYDGMPLECGLSGKRGKLLLWWNIHKARF